jgi:hypothetical protein
MSREEIYGTSLSIFLSLYPKISAIASGATPIRSAVAYPIGRSRQKEGEESKLVIKTSWWTWGLDIIGCISSARNFGYIADKMNIDYSHRELFMKVKKDKLRKVCILNQSNKAAKYNSRVASSRQNLNVVVWYVSNVSIIFDAPCLFLHHLPIVSLHLVAFLYAFRN